MNKLLLGSLLLTSTAFSTPVGRYFAKACDLNKTIEVDGKNFDAVGLDRHHDGYVRSTLGVSVLERLKKSEVVDGTVDREIKDSKRGGTRIDSWSDGDREILSNAMKDEGCLYTILDLEKEIFDPTDFDKDGVRLYKDLSKNTF